MGCLCVGSVLSGGGSVPSAKATPETWVNMVNEIQKAALSTRLGIPMIYGIDAVHGHNNVYGATIFPHNVGLGVTRQVLVLEGLNSASHKVEWDLFLWFELVCLLYGRKTETTLCFLGILIFLRGLGKQPHLKLEQLESHMPLLHVLL